MGFFNPDLAEQALVAIRAMDFEGKSDIERAIAKNKTLVDTVAKLQADLNKAAYMIGKMKAEKGE